MPLKILLKKEQNMELYKSIFDLVKRVNQRAVSKKSLESLIYSGAFDCFKEYTRAQYFYQAPGDAVALG